MSGQHRSEEHLEKMLPQFLADEATMEDVLAGCDLEGSWLAEAFYDAVTELADWGGVAYDDLARMTLRAVEEQWPEERFEAELDALPRPSKAKRKRWWK